MLPQLEELERAYSDSLVVVGVHSAKFPAERAGGSLRSAIQRYEVEHPVANDEHFDLWSQYGVRAWPTLMFLDPAGRVVGKHEGEAPAEALIDVVGNMIGEYDRAGLIDRTPIDPIGLDPQPETELAFPGKVLADESSERLFIADTGHHRIVITDLEGSNPQVIGGPERGYADGAATDARFNQPQGMVLDGNTLYVADTRNAAVRAISLEDMTVTTVAGTGRAGTSMPTAGMARNVDLRSPWDLALVGDQLYIAMAGTHQVWVLDLAQGTVAPYAGSGVEGLRDGDLEASWLAQPSDLSIENGFLYVVDSETSSVRQVSLPPCDDVRTLVGTGLFDFGDIDGIGDVVRLQHPIGLDARGDVIYLADSYNHKLKRLSISERKVTSWVGSGEAGNVDGPANVAAFHEPSGVSVTDMHLYVADTNNHAIRRVTLADGTVETLPIEFD